MKVTEEYCAEYGVKQVADHLRDRLRLYLEAQYHVRDTGIIEERRALLEEMGTIGQQPYLETTPSYQSGELYDQLNLPVPLGDTFTELARSSRVLVSSLICMAIRLKPFSRSSTRGKI